MSIDSNLEKILKRVEKPARYIGGEVNMVRKDVESEDGARDLVRFGFAFPDTYEIGMSYMGLQILYNILNKDDRIYCERVFAPAPDMEELMRQEGRPLYTLETFTPLNQLDLLGFTLQYEMAYTNILNMLDLGDIPIRREDRIEAFGNLRRSGVRAVACERSQRKARRTPAKRRGGRALVYPRVRSAAFCTLDTAERIWYSGDKGRRKPCAMI